MSAVPDIPPARHGHALLLAGIILVGLNLRPALSSISPVLEDIRLMLGLSAVTAGWLTTLPVFCLGLFAPLAPLLARRIGPERGILVALAVLAGGMLLRTRFGIPGLFAGTVIAGAGIGIAGVLLPGIVKRNFPAQADLMTGVYTMALCAGAALAAGFTVPLAQYFGSWRPAIASWALLAVLAALLWLPQVRHAHTLNSQAQVPARLWREPLAWQVTLFMGLQSSTAYIVFGWLPSILQARGLTPLAAGGWMSVSVMMQLITSLGGPWLARRARDQRGPIVLMLTLTAAGLFGCLYAPATQLPLWAVVLGLGQGGNFSLALSLLVLRTRNAATAAQLSGMAQGLGYTLAALGPLTIGMVREWSGSWQATGPLLALIVLGALIAGLAAGRDRKIGHD